MADQGAPRLKSFALRGTQIELRRVGYGAMQLAGPHVFGPPRDMEAAFTVLREAMAIGINHIDTSDFYGPHITNQIIKQALHPYEKGLIIVTKVGARRGPDKSWILASSKEELTAAVHDNLRNLGLEVLEIVNLRVGPPLEPEGKSLIDAMTALSDLKKAGLIRHIGVSNVTASQLKEAQQVTEIVCVQNHYNLAHRRHDDLVKACADQGIAFVPFFPMGGFNPLQSASLTRVAAQLNTTANQVALAWLLQRSPNILIIPGTSSVTHLRENVQSETLELTEALIADLDTIGNPSVSAS